MGTTFVGIGDFAFWLCDSILELWLRFLALHVEDPVEPGGLKSKIRDGWLLASCGFFNVCIQDGLEEAVSTPEGDKFVRAAIGRCWTRSGLPRRNSARAFSTSWGSPGASSTPTSRRGD